MSPGSFEAVVRPGCQVRPGLAARPKHFLGGSGASEFPANRAKGESGVRSIGRRRPLLFPGYLPSCFASLSWELVGAGVRVSRALAIVDSGCSAPGRRTFSASAGSLGSHAGVVWRRALGLVDFWFFRLGVAGQRAPPRVGRDSAPCVTSVGAIGRGPGSLAPKGSQPFRRQLEFARFRARRNPRLNGLASPAGV